MKLTGIVKWFVGIGKVIGVIASGIIAVERAGEGPQKREEVIKVVQKVLNEIDHSILDLPDWLIDFLANSVVLGAIIDLLVEVANRFGVFEFLAKRVSAS